ncbi:hypothetical protein C9383_01085 [Pseudomonas palleroniana]|uniref:HEAT repeat domain-containing protein n=1 Tax=Pseudomonas palleroniana TaxID=191390 RepID=A0A1H5H9V9_9PSED|nr:MULTISPECIES: hypothetical protein [Pseudomonas]KAB0566297.1 hypothetical protein F7R03_15285 [Pseudomonas palleroniana]MBM9487786.1 hypothetical protein [Pseudomonas sp. ICBG1301]PTC32445.1 hypothetical protein C9383_01085 [Pseudomonas palleroniana]SEE24058.1 hypothetical protein SAMN04490198_0898 [Pseudomonas palleroniana]
MTMRYHDPSLDRDEAVRFLATPDPNKVTEALISIGLNEMDSTWAQETCLQFVTNPDDDIASAAIIAIGHIARRFGEVEITKISASFEQAKRRSPSLSGVVDDALGDIEMYT